jgi:hypothetical protein
MENYHKNKTYFKIADANHGMFHNEVFNSESDVISTKLKKTKCSLFGHKFIYGGRTNGNIWGWNNYVCERCGTKIDSLTD